MYFIGKNKTPQQNIKTYFSYVRIFQFQMDSIPGNHVRNENQSFFFSNEKKKKKQHKSCENNETVK